MKYYNKLQINFDASIDTFNSITDLLGTIPTDKNFNSFPNNIPNTWTYQINTIAQDNYFDFINIFLDILENKYKKLADLGIQKNDISIWHLYEYDQQCNMEFDPTRLKRLGDNGITFCISCWDSGQEYNTKNIEEYKNDFNKIRTLVNEFDPCGLIKIGAPLDEYDCLTNHLLSSHYNKTSRIEIKKLILHEIEYHFGTPDLNEIQEPYKTKFYQDIEILLDKVENELLNSSDKL